MICEMEKCGNIVPMLTRVVVQSIEANPPLPAIQKKLLVCWSCFRKFGSVHEQPTDVALSQIQEPTK